MRLRPLLLVTCLSLATAGSAHAKRWNAVRSADKFTDIEYCRVEPGNAFSRSMWKGLAGAAITLHFFAERRGNEIRAGVISEPLIPIAGDVQIRVDQNPLHTITAADTPLDAGPRFAMPAMPYVSEEQRLANEKAMTAAMAASSPFKAYSGEKARALLAEILAGKRVIMRTVGVNAALSTDMEFDVHPDLAKALAECGIDTKPSAPEPASPQ